MLMYSTFRLMVKLSEMSPPGTFRRQWPLPG